MKSWNPAVFTQWLVAAASMSVSRTPLSVMILGRPLVLGRMASGGVLALEDRCPHRHAPLSSGRMTDLGIACPYHGWTFGQNGRCTAIPGLAPGKALPGVGAHAVDVHEMDGLVWVRLAPGSTASPPKQLAEVPPASRRFLWQTRWQASVVDAMENFLDPLHTHLIHPGLVRDDHDRSPVQARLTRNDAGFVVRYEGQPEQSGLLYRLFESPRSSECVHVLQPGTAQIEYRYQNDAVVRITLHFTPETPTTTHVFTTLHVENRWAPAWAVRLFVWPFLKRVATQDARILALQSANIARFGPTHQASTELDLVRAYLEQIWETASYETVLPQEKTIALYL